MIVEGFFDFKVEKGLNLAGTKLNRRHVICLSTYIMHIIQNVASFLSFGGFLNACSESLFQNEVKGVFLWKIIRRLNPISIILFNIG